MPTAHIKSDYQFLTLWRSKFQDHYPPIALTPDNLTLFHYFSIVNDKGIQYPQILVSSLIGKKVENNIIQIEL